MEYKYQVSNDITIEWIKKNLKHLIFPDVTRKEGRINKKLIGSLVSLDGTAVGLLLCIPDQNFKHVRLMSLRVASDHEGKGLGTKLMSSLLEYLEKNEYENAEIFFHEHWEGQVPLNKILKNTQWEQPEIDQRIILGKAADCMPLYDGNDRSLPEGYSFFPWGALQPADLTLIKSKFEKEVELQGGLWPFFYEDIIENWNSIALKYKKEVVGWLVTHRITEQTVEFTSLFLSEGHRSFKLAHLLMGEAIYRQVASGIPQFTFSAKADNPTMTKFVIRNHEWLNLRLVVSYRSMRSFEEK